MTVNNAIRRGVGDYNKLDLLSEMEAIRKKVFTPYNIKKGFIDTGIWPFKPQIAYEFIENNKIPVTAKAGLDLSYAGQDIEAMRAVVTHKKAIKHTRDNRILVLSCSTIEGTEFNEL